MYDCTPYRMFWWALLDCLNMYDMSVTIFMMGVALVLGVIVTKRCIKIQRWTKEATKEDCKTLQLKRNWWGHISILVFILSYVLTMALGVTIFLMIKNQSVSYHELDNSMSVYLLAQQFYIFTLDIMYIGVSYMYCKAFITLGSVERENTLDETFYKQRIQWHRRTKIIFSIIVMLYIVAQVVSIVIFSLTDNSTAWPFRFMAILQISLTLLSTLITVIFFYCFYKNVVKHLEVSRKAKMWQKCRLVSLAMSAITRCLVNVAYEADLMHLLRKFNPYNNCLDDNWYFSLFLLIYSIVSNVGPLIIFLKVFTLDQFYSNSTVFKTMEENTSDSILIY